MRRMREAVQGHALRIFPVAILALLGGCVAIPENQPAPCPPPSEVVVTGQMDDMMQYYDSLRKHPHLNLPNYTTG